MTTIGPLPPDQVEVAIATIAQAFLQDPVLIYVLPDEARRRAALPALFRASVKHYLRHCRIDATPDVAGVAQWQPPGSGTPSLGQMIRSGMLLTPLQIGLGPFQRMMRMNGPSEKAHKAAMPEPHWYLASLAVDPTRQGQGIGSALLRHGLARAEADGVPCYLETSNERNLPLYERYGFEVVHAGEMPLGNLRFWGMRREA